MSKEFVPPRFNLREDTQLPGPLSAFRFSYPIDAAAVQKDQYEVRLHVTEAYKELRIRMYVTDPPSIKAMAGGTFTQEIEGDDIVAVLDVKSAFTFPVFPSHFGNKEAPANIWFANWIMANRIPSRIYYRNVRLNWQDQVSVQTEERKHIDAGEDLGTPRLYQPPDMKSFYWIGIRVEYDDSTKDAPRYMHPVEFFNLLFWQEEHDPIFAITKPKPESKDKDKAEPSPEIPPPYEHPLLQKMSESTAHLGLGDARSDNWLGLRPPLRTSKRLIWEAKREHQYSEDNWRSQGRVDSVLQNPLLYKGWRGYAGSSKCNVFAADISFRAGFRYRVYTTSSNDLNYRKSVAARRWTSLPPKGSTVFTSRHEKIFQIGVVPGSGRVVASENGAFMGVSYPADVGVILNITDDTSDRWDTAIQQGLVLIYARQAYPKPETPACEDEKQCTTRDCQRNTRGSRPCYDNHVVFIDSITKITDTAVKATIVDQTCKGASDAPHRCLVSYCGRRNTETSRFIALTPAGDPTEPWGVFDLNAIRMMTKSEKDELANASNK